MATASYATLAADATVWADHEPDYHSRAELLSAAAATVLDRTAAAELILNIAARSPVAVAFSIRGAQDSVTIAHSLTKYPADPTNPCVFDNLVVGLVGDDVATSVPVVLPADAFTNCNNTRALTTAAILGPTGHSAAAPVYHHGPHAAGAADINTLRARHVLLLPCRNVDVVVGTMPLGRYSMPGFHAGFQTLLDSGNPSMAADGAHIETWFRLASTYAAAGESVLAIDLVSAADPLVQGSLNRWVAQVKTSLLTKAGRGGPVLTQNGFDVGIASIRGTLEATAATQLTFERTKNLKTFSDKHGDILTQRMYHLTDKVRDEDLPEVHILLARTPKGKDHAVVLGLVGQRTLASSVPLSLTRIPIVSPKVMEEVFRSFQVAGPGTTFAKHLSPFAMVCEGHVESSKIQSSLKQAEIAEGGSLSLADAERLISNDVRFPTTPQISAEKLYAWSILIDLFFGVDHAISDSVRAFVIEVGPSLHHVHDHAGGGSIGMNLVHRIMFDAQQDFFAWANKRANGAPCPVPDFAHLTGLVNTSRAQSLADLPAAWKLMLPAGPKNNPPGATPTLPSGPVVAAHADARLLSRFADCPHSRVSDLIGGHDVTVPKHAGKDVCLVWALTGQCNSTCKRKAQHVRYSRDVNAKISTLLDECGVANPQA